MHAYKNRVLKDLHTILITDNADKLFGSIRAYLKKNWFFTLGDKREGSILSYTALPEDELTNLLADLAIFVKENDKNTNENECALSILMPTISLDSLSNDKAYPDLRELDVKEVIKSHIIGREGKYLIPVKQFIELQQYSPDKWINHYCDYKIHDSNFYSYLAVLSNEEYERLANHSTYTKAVSEAKKNYDINFKEQGNFFFHLKELCRHITFESDFDDVSGKGAYQAISNFKDYYNQLDIDNKKKISHFIIIQIEDLLSIPYDQKTNFSCRIRRNIALLRSRLNKEINWNVQPLKEIGLTETSFKLYLEEKKQQWTDCVANFKNALNCNIHRGSDQLGLTINLITELGVDYRKISSLKDLHALLKLPLAEFTSLCQNTSIKQQFIFLFTKNALYHFIKSASLSTLEMLLSSCGEALVNKLYIDENDNVEISSLSTLLISLDAERCQLVYENMIDPFIKTSADFASLLEDLSYEQCTTIYESVKTRLSQLIKNGYDFVNVITFISPEQRTHAFENTKERLSELDMDGNDFHYLLYYLSSEQRDIVIEKTKTRLPSIITEDYHLTRLNYLSSEQLAIINESIKTKLFKLGNNAKDVNHLSLQNQKVSFFEATSVITKNYLKNLDDQRQESTAELKI